MGSLKRFRDVSMEISVSILYWAYVSSGEDDWSPSGAPKHKQEKLNLTHGYNGFVFKHRNKRDCAWALKGMLFLFFIFY